MNTEETFISDQLNNYYIIRKCSSQNSGRINTRLSGNLATDNREKGEEKRGHTETDGRDIKLTGTPEFQICKISARY